MVMGKDNPLFIISDADFAESTIYRSGVGSPSFLNKCICKNLSDQKRNDCGFIGLYRGRDFNKKYANNDLFLGILGRIISNLDKLRPLYVITSFFSSLRHILE